jgi:putative transposase
MFRRYSSGIHVQRRGVGGNRVSPVEERECTRSEPSDSHTQSFIQHSGLIPRTLEVGDRTRNGFIKANQNTKLCLVMDLVKVNVRVDHIHLILVIPPRVAVAEVIQFLKSQSSSILKEKFAFLKKVFWGRSSIWSRGYCVSSVGLNEKQILSYVTHQEKEDRGQLQLDL